MAKKNKVLILGLFFVLAVCGVIYFLQNYYSYIPDCFKGDFFCFDSHTAYTCSFDGKWMKEVCIHPKLCGAGGVKGCGLPSTIIVDGDPTEFCGDLICQPWRGEDKYNCPTDCGLPPPPPSPPPSPPDTPPATLVDSLAQKQRPLVGGLQIEMQKNNVFSHCSLGAIVSYQGQNYILTASHCAATSPTSGVPSQSDIGLRVRQGGEEIGFVYKTADYTGGVDAALISIHPGISSAHKDFLGNSISGFGVATKGLEVYKIGGTTGLTYGKIVDLNIVFRGTEGSEWKGFEVKGDDGKFCEGRDSGAAIISVKENKIIGIISYGGETTCGSNLPEDIKSSLGLR